VTTAELSSLKWEKDGEMSAQDTLKLVQQLSKSEAEHHASELLHLSARYKQLE